MADQRQTRILELDQYSFKIVGGAVEYPKSIRDAASRLDLLTISQWDLDNAGRILVPKLYEDESMSMLKQIGQMRRDYSFIEIDPEATFNKPVIVETRRGQAATSSSQDPFSLF
jgi:hypothetical protein